MYSIFKSLAISSLLCSSLLSVQANPTINNITYPSVIEIYEKFEVNFDLIANYSSPYDYREIEVTGTFDNGQYDVFEQIDGFFYRPFSFTCNSSGIQVINSVESATFALRYTPRKTGNYSFSITAKDLDGTTCSSSYTFTVYAETGKRYPGFINLHPGEDHFSREDGSRYMPIAANMAFAHADKTVCEYDTWITQFQSNGGNSVRIWANAYWGFRLEGNQIMAISLAPGNYNSNQ